MKIAFHSWTAGDAPAIHCILHDTWEDAYSSFIPKEDLFGYLDQHYNINAIKESTADPKIVGIVAEVDEVPAGYVRMHYDREEQRLYAQQLYILPKYQRLGLGRKLMEFAADRAKLLGLDCVWLGVMVKNEPAAIWYKKIGFQISETTPFIMGNTNVDHYIGFVPVDKITSVKKARQIPTALLHKIKLILDFEQPDGILPKYCYDLLEQQKKEWQWLAEGHLALGTVKTREIVCGNFIVKLQYNPKRIASTTANTNPKAISERKCFLCLENLPEQQMGILYGNKYLILCNPAPIFTAHFTVIHTDHVPQEFSKSIGVLLDLAKDISPDFTIFYNGPKGGASAPDHLHFQVTPRREIPVEGDAVDMRRREKFYYKNHVAAFRLTNYGRQVFVLEATDKFKLIEFLQVLIDTWKNIRGSTEEPIMNIICSYQEQMWRVIIFPRSKHRPEVYFREGDDRVVISPAAVDIGGFIVTPLEKDFLRVDAKLIEDIFTEVSEKQEVVEQITKAVS